MAHATWSCNNCGLLPVAEFANSVFENKQHICKRCKRARTLLQKLRGVRSDVDPEMSVPDVHAVFAAFGTTCYVSGAPYANTLIQAVGTLPLSVRNAVPVVTQIPTRGVMHLPANMADTWRNDNRRIHDSRTAGAAVAEAAARAEGDAACAEDAVDAGTPEKDRRRYVSVKFPPRTASNAEIDGHAEMQFAKFVRSESRFRSAAVNGHVNKCDKGRDIVGAGFFAQVKARFRQQDRRATLAEIDRLIGCTTLSRSDRYSGCTRAFASVAFTEDALQRANEEDVALFTFDETCEFVAFNRAAVAMVQDREDAPRRIESKKNKCDLTGYFERVRPTENVQASYLCSSVRLLLLIRRHTMTIL